jgi:hypothetical protein
MAYWLARIFAVIGLVAPALFFFALVLSDLVPSPAKTWGVPIQAIAISVAYISILFIFVAAIGSALTILFGWSAERRSHGIISN